jgi:hypothetical protein
MPCLPRNSTKVLIPLVLFAYRPLQKFSTPKSLFITLESNLKLANFQINTVSSSINNSTTLNMIPTWPSTKCQNEFGKFKKDPHPNFTSLQRKF